VFKMNGVDKIAQERKEQIEKHGYSVENDCRYVEGQLLMAVAAIVQMDVDRWPADWNRAGYTKIMSKPRAEQLAIAGALIAAEIDCELAYNGN